MQEGKCQPVAQVFEQYVEAPGITGIQHLNFSQHGPQKKARTEFQKLASKPLFELMKRLK